MNVKSLILLGMLACHSGCGNSGEKISVGETSFSDAIKAFDEKDYENAVVCFTKALERGTLNVDLMCEARLKRAKSRMELEEFDEALDDLEFLIEGGAPDASDVLAARGDLSLKQGLKDEARKYYQDARQLNPKLSIPKELL